jgi:hypothetical protein
LFTDLVDSTAIAARLGPDEAETLRQTHFGILRSAAQHTGGVEVKTLGDGIMLMYTSPSRAVSCGVAIQQGVERHNHRASQPLEVRVGIATGEATEEDGDFFGDAVVEASRLCAAAQGHQILTTELVKMMLGRNATHELTPVGDLELKGIPEPVPAVEVLWEPEATPGAIPLPARFVGTSGEGVFGFFGRAPEMQGISDALKRAAAERRPNVVLLAGEPGIGKTTLAAQAARAAHAECGTVLFGHCTEDLGAPYQPWIEALRHLIEHAPQELLDAHVERHGGAVARIVPALTQRTQAAPLDVSADPDSERFLLLEAVSGLLAATATENPVVVVLDDFQWADNASVQLVRHLAGATSSSSLLLLVTYRDSDIGRGHPLTALVGDLPRITTTVRFTLHGLDDQEFVELVEGIAGHEMDENGLGFVHAIHRETDGNPFFTTEMLRHLWETGAIVLEHGRYVLSAPIDAAGLPSSIRDVVGRRVERLGDEPARVLTAASVIGREFDLGVLADVTESSEDELLDLMDEMVSASLVVEHPDVPGLYRFEHALIQHTLYQDLGTTRRQRMHQRVAEALERAGASSTRPAAELARHWLAATRPTDVNKALEYVREAGQEALDALAPDDAMSWFTQGLELADRSGVDDELRCDLLLGLGNAQRDAGKPEHRETLLSAATLAQELGDAERLAAAALGNCRGTVVMVVDPERVAALEAALDATPEDNKACRAQLLAALAGHIDGREWERRRDLSLQALALTEGGGDDALRLAILNRTGLSIALPELLDERLERAHEAIRLADALQDLTQQVQARMNGLQPIMESGDRATADRIYAELVALADKTQLPFHLWQTGIVRTAMLLLRAELEAAEASNDAVLELGLATGQPEALGVYGSVLLNLREYQARLDEVVEVIEQAARDLEQIDSLRPALASVWCQIGDLHRAREWYERDARTQFRDLTISMQWLAAMRHAANAAIALGDRDGAATIMELVLPYRSRFIYTAGTNDGSPALTLAQLAIFLGRYDEAPGFLAEARDIFRRFDAPYFATLTDLEEAVLLSRRGDDGDRDRARDVAAAVREVAVARGFRMIERRADALLAELAPG